MLQSIGNDPNLFQLVFFPKFGLEQTRASKCGLGQARAYMFYD